MPKAPSERNQKNQTQPNKGGGRGGARQGAGRKPGAVTPHKKSLIEAAQGYGEKALQALVAVLDDPAAPHSSIVSAANAILDRGYGKPVAPVEHDATNEFAEALKAISRAGSAAPIKGQ